ncbi:MAG: hypothetical protein QOJ50_3987, partial [Cryptosporangiaceae bacterium]|nr:hypothetical protein [Cryptosporangiaceae bacterium]
MWPEVDQVPWVTLTHNYGDASDVPGLLRGCADPEAGVASDALADLGNVLHHQGGWVCPAATAALPFLLDLALDEVALDPPVHHRDQVTELIGWIAREATAVAPRFLDAGWPDALALAVPRILALLADPDPGVRRQATLLVAGGGLPSAVAVAALRARWRVEPDRVTRWDLVLALGELAAHDLAAHHSATADLTAELHGLLHDEDPQIRLAAVHALAEAEPEAAPRELGTLIQAVLRDDAAGWQSSAWIGGTRETIVHATGQLLHRDPVAAAAFTIGVGRSPDAGQRIAALGLAGGLLAEWRTVTTTVLPYVGGQLAAAEAEARYRAAYVFGCLGAEGVAYADRLAELTSDEAMRDSRLRYTVGDAAVWALARQHD